MGKPTDTTTAVEPGTPVASDNQSQPAKRKGRKPSVVSWPANLQSWTVQDLINANNALSKQTLVVRLAQAVKANEIVRLPAVIKTEKAGRPRMTYSLAPVVA